MKKLLPPSRRAVEDGGRARQTRLTRPWLRGAMTAAAVVATIGATTTSAFAFGTAVPCSTRTESTAFSRWNDSASYFLMPNGGFESGATDWSLTGGASVIADNETFKVRSASDTKGLRIPAGATAESRTICVGRGEDSIRLFVKNARVPGSILHVEAIVRNPVTGQTAQTAFDVNGDAAPSGWSPTMRLSIPNLLGGTTGTQELTFRFSTRGTAATWVIDDVYVDPMKLK
jgi:hypothetical protein